MFHVYISFLLLLFLIGFFVKFLTCILLLKKSPLNGKGHLLRLKYILAGDSPRRLHSEMDRSENGSSRPHRRSHYNHSHDEPSTSRNEPSRSRSRLRSTRLASQNASRLMYARAHNGPNMYAREHNERYLSTSDRSRSRSDRSGSRNDRSGSRNGRSGSRNDRSGSRNDRSRSRNVRSRSQDDHSPSSERSERTQSIFGLVPGSILAGVESHLLLLRRSLLLLSHLARPPPANFLDKPPAPPTSSAFLENIPESRITTKGVECSICLAKFRRGTRARILPCKHQFHLKCIRPWLKKTNSCPLCRHELPTDDQPPNDDLMALDDDLRTDLLEDVWLSPAESQAESQVDSS